MRFPRSGKSGGQAAGMPREGKVLRGLKGSCGRSIHPAGRNRSAGGPSPGQQPGQGGRRPFRFDRSRHPKSRLQDPPARKTDGGRPSANQENHQFRRRRRGRNARGRSPGACGTADPSEWCAARRHCVKRSAQGQGRGHRRGFGARTGVSGLRRKGPRGFDRNRQRGVSGARGARGGPSGDACREAGFSRVFGPRRRNGMARDAFSIAATIGHADAAKSLLPASACCLMPDEAFPKAEPGGGKRADARAPRSISVLRRIQQCLLSPGGRRGDRGGRAFASETARWARQRVKREHNRGEGSRTNRRCNRTNIHI